MSRTRAGVFVIAISLVVICGNATLILPNTSGIDGHLTADLKVDHFFSLWLVFNNVEVKTSGKVAHRCLTPQLRQPIGKVHTKV